MKNKGGFFSQIIVIIITILLVLLSMYAIKFGLENAFNISKNSAEEFCEEYGMELKSGGYVKEFDKYYCVEIEGNKYIEKEIKKAGDEWGFVE